jgi:hypothetical protein
MSQDHDHALPDRLRALRVDPPDDGFSARLLERLQVESAPSANVVRPGFRRHRRGLALVAVAAVFVSGAAAALMGTQGYRGWWFPEQAAPAVAPPAVESDLSPPVAPAERVKKVVEVPAVPSRALPEPAPHPQPHERTTEFPRARVVPRLETDLRGAPRRSTSAEDRSSTDRKVERWEQAATPAVPKLELVDPSAASAERDRQRPEAAPRVHRPVPRVAADLRDRRVDARERAARQSGRRPSADVRRPNRDIETPRRELPRTSREVQREQERGRRTRPQR